MDNYDDVAATVFFTHKPYQDKFTIELFSEESGISNFYGYVPGNGFIGANDDKIIKHIKEHDMSKSFAVIVDKQSFEDNKVKVIKIFDDCIKDFYVCHRTNLYKLEQLIIHMEYGSLYDMLSILKSKQK